MPELPEVQTVVDDLKNGHLIGAKILKAELFWLKSIGSPSPSEFCLQIASQTILDISRRGKYILLHLKEMTLLVHLRMSGRLVLSNSPQEAPGLHERVRLILDSERALKFEDQRKFGKIELVANPEEKLGSLGVEPLTAAFTIAYLFEALKGRQTKIKSFLLDQKIIAGLGNIYVDEALFEARIHPTRASESLAKKEVEALHIAIQKVLATAVSHKGTSLGSTRANFHSSNGKRGENLSNLSVYSRQDLPCPRCQNQIVKIVSNGRGTHFCPRCQNK